MTEIKKLTKISLIVVAIIPFIFGVILVFLFDLTLNYEGWTNPLHPRAFGGMCFLGSIFAIVMLRKKEWEEIKLTFMFLYSWFIPVILVELVLVIILGPTLLPQTISQMIIDQILMWIMLLLGIVSYIKQRS
ncbi:MAG: hypothetical protein JSV62_03520 [Promethearchaeota archaeon]|nr:MAG: hypothetical protein JSV62_03520 [Candidatus Lokiarchaeota archaeon]